MTTETFNVPVDNKTGDTQEYVQAMVDKADGKASEPLLAGKYTSEEELSKGTIELIKKQHGSLEEFYKGLESGIGKEKVETPELTPPEVKPEGLPKIEEVPVTSGDFNKFSDEFVSTGSLSDESYKELENKHGLPKEMVDTYIKGLQLDHEKTSDKLIESVGSKEAYSEMIVWAKDSLSKEQIQIYNNAVDSGDYNQMELAVAGLHSKYKSAVGNTPTLLDGQGRGSVSGYQSMAEMKNDMANPQYQKDPVFRQRVMDRARVTKAF